MQAIIFYCESNFGEFYKYAKIANNNKEVDEIIRNQYKLSTEIVDVDIIDVEL